MLNVNTQANQDITACVASDPGACGIQYDMKDFQVPSSSGVSIIFKIRVIYKAWFEGFEFFIVWPYEVFHKMQVVFYKSAHFMYLWGINSVFAKCALQSSKMLK